MRDLILFAVVFGLLPFVFRRPVIGVLLFTWISLMNPHRLTYGAAFDFPFAAIVAAVTIVAAVLSPQPKRVPLAPIPVVLLLFAAWMMLTTFFAMEQTLAWREFDRVMKTVFMTFIAILVLSSARDVRAYAWVVALSLGFYGVKGGLFTLATAGGSRVSGPPYSYIGDNNTVALALVTVAPLLWYWYRHASNCWIRRAMAAAALLTLIAILGSYSRGALLGLGAMLLFLWLKSRRKLPTMVVLALIVPVALAFMPESWSERMDSIGEYREDASALGRINSWKFAATVASEHFLGGGFRVFTPDMFKIYAPNPDVFFDAHSIYFQVLGEHGFVGLLWFLFLMAAAWRTATRIRRKCTGSRELDWAADLAAMCQVSIAGYAVAGAFLTLAYYDLYYCILALLVVLEKSLPAVSKVGNAMVPRQSNSWTLLGARRR